LTSFDAIWFFRDNVFSQDDSVVGFQSEIKISQAEEEDEEEDVVCTAVIRGGDDEKNRKCTG
jgi:hypothetical protein